MSDPAMFARQASDNNPRDVDRGYTGVGKCAARGHRRPGPPGLGSRTMCGIVGIYCKSPALGDQLGQHLSRMLIQMGDRGPDSAGVAIYRDPVADGSSKLSLHAPGTATDWDAVVAQLDAALGVDASHVVGAEHALVTVRTDAETAQAYVAASLP